PPSLGRRVGVKAWALRSDVDPDSVTQVDGWPAASDPYLRGGRSVVVDDRFRKAARDIVPNSRREGRALTDVMAWVNGTMKYDHSPASPKASADHALETRAGPCRDDHGPCAALGRSLGHPTR